MKVSRLEAENVHGYLPLRVEFNPDLTFLTGLNGSGKTSALRLLMGLLTPNLEELANISFTRARATVSDQSDEIVIEARRTPEGLVLTSTATPGDLSLTMAELELLTEARPRDEQRTPIRTKLSDNAVFQSISQMSTPMFLGLDRRFYYTGGFTEEVQEVRRREVFYRHSLPDAPGLRGTVAAGLADVNYLVSTTLHEIRAMQERLDNDLRNKILLEAFRFKPAEIAALGAQPSRAALDTYRKKQKEAEKAAAELQLPIADVQTALTAFFERMSGVVASLERDTPSPTAKGKAKRRKTNSAHALQLVEWAINKPQTDRILEHLMLLEQYNSDRAKLHEPIDKFLSLANGFLKQTGKQLVLTDRADLMVTLASTEVSRPIWALSSGERQIVVMLAHLSLNKRLTGSGVFIVDEPELSLHLAWQERFVAAITEANPSVQLIMATHSPAIVLDRTAYCRSLS